MAMRKMRAAKTKKPSASAIYKKRAAKPEADRVPMGPKARLKGRNKLRGVMI